MAGVIKKTGAKHTTANTGHGVRRLKRRLQHLRLEQLTTEHSE
jgi:hypothetical protein